MSDFFHSRDGNKKEIHTNTATATQYQRESETRSKTQLRCGNQENMQIEKAWSFFRVQLLGRKKWSQWVLQGPETTWSWKATTWFLKNCALMLVGKRMYSERWNIFDILSTNPTERLKIAFKSMRK